MPALLLAARVAWECPNCWVIAVSAPLAPGEVKMHTCPGLHGLAAPLIAAGSDCKVTATLRGDYLNGEVQRRGDDGRPYMNVETTYADGHTDLAVNAGLARGWLG